MKPNNTHNNTTPSTGQTAFAPTNPLPQKLKTQNFYPVVNDRRKFYYWAKLKTPTQHLVPSTLNLVPIFTAILLLFQLQPLTTHAQELNCQVRINTPKLQTADPKIFKTLETAIFEFMNNRRWTNDVYKQEEKIECSILINITSELSSNKYEAQITVQSNRPVFNSSYNSVMLNHNDKDFAFEYSEYQPLDFSENAHLSNLTSVLAYYAYVIIGYDYDSYSLNGGTPYFLKAQTIVNNAASETSKSVKGWKAFDGTRNRYWLVKQLLEARFKACRQVYYDYHLKGLDMMYDKPELGRKVILNGLNSLMAVHADNPNSMILQVYFNGKSEEYINIFSGAPASEKAQAIDLLSVLDAANASEYRRIMK